MSNQDIENFKTTLNALSKTLEQASNLASNLQCTGVKIVTHASLIEPPKKYYKTYKFTRYIGDPDASDNIYINEENAKKRVEELKEEWSDAHYLEINFSDSERETA